MTIERRSSLRKAPTADVVDALTTGSEGHDVTQVEQPAAQVTTGEKHVGVAARRAKRRMLPFSSKIEMNLRDEMDDYLTEHNITIIDFLDEAIRDRLNR